MLAALIVVTAACLGVAVLLAGAGHGWTTAFLVSLAGLVTSPVAVVAWAKRRDATGKRIALLLVAVAIVANLILVNLTKAEGARYFESEWSSNPEIVVIWAALWAVWQVVALAALFWPGRPGWTEE
jgi:phosphoglycerol transferase MdoB-like AlkP superfamily enzyme